MTLAAQIGTPMSEAAARPAAVSERRISIVGAALVALGPISLALYTPAMQELSVAFGATHAEVQHTLTAFFGGFAVAQLACGPLSDAFGRRPIGFVFMAIYVAASLVAVFAPTIEVLTVARLFQGVGAAAGIALSRAMVRDLFTGQASTRIMTTIGIMLAIGPAVSPTLGGLVLEVAGWPWLFVLMLVYGVVLVAVLVFAIPETLERPDIGLIHPGRLVLSYGRLLMARGFMRASLVIGLSVGGLYALAIMMPFVMMGQLGLTPTQYGLVMICQTLSYMLGGFVTQRLMRRVAAPKLVPVGLAIVGISAIVFALGLRLLEPSVVIVILPVQFWAFGIALILPATQTAALADYPHMAGAASALMGFLQMATGFIAGLTVALFADPIIALATVMPAMGVAAVVLHAVLAPRRRRAP
jgi:DHA1 family bicyclomycin/chloramphenicol resistance-like MFS transporter